VFSNTLSLCFSLRVRERFSYIYRPK
jgi:hypothetical protein